MIEIDRILKRTPVSFDDLKDALDKAAVSPDELKDALDKATGSAHETTASAPEPSDRCVEQVPGPHHSIRPRAS